MRLAINIFRLSQQPLGQQIYVEQVLRALFRAAPEDWQMSVTAVGLSGRAAHRQRRQLIDPQRRARWSLLPLPVTMQTWLADHTGSNLSPPSFRSADVVHTFGGAPLPSGLVNVIGTIQDVIPLRLNEGDPQFIEAVRRHLQRLATQAKKIVTISDFSKGEIVDSLQIDPARVAVIPNGVDLQRFQPLSESGFAEANERLSRLAVGDRPYLLHLGGAAARKNAARVVQAFDRLKSKHRIPHSLVFVGANKLLDDVRCQIEASPYQEEIIQLHYVDDRDALVLLQRADILVFPSTYEGFGLPPLEAMACGVPVALSNAASLPEVGGDAAVYFDPLDVDSMAAAIEKIIGDDALRKEMIARGLSRSQSFSWDRNARSTLQLYRSIQETTA